MKNFLTDNLFTCSLAQPSYSYMADGGMMVKGGGVGDLRAGDIYSKKMPYYYKGKITDYTIQPIVVDMLDDEYVYYSNYQLPRTAEKMDIKEFKRQLEDGSIKPYHIKDLRGEITYLVDGRLDTFLILLYINKFIDCIPFTNQEFEKIKARFNYERHKVQLGAGRRGLTGGYTDNIYVNIKRNDWGNTRYISITKITNSDKLNEHFNKIKVAEQDSRGRDTYFIYDTVDDFVKNHETNMKMGGRVGKYADGGMMAKGGEIMENKNEIIDFVKNNSYFDYEGEEYGKLNFATRKNGSVSSETASHKDIVEAKSLKNKIEKKFQGLDVEIDVVDEWVLLFVYEKVIVENEYEYKYIFKKDYQGQGFSNSHSSLDEFIKYANGYLDDINWSDIKEKLNKITEYKDNKFTGWYWASPIILKRAGENGNKWGYNFYLIKARRKN